MKIHDEEKMHKCEFCKKNFSQNGSVKRHVKTVHENVKTHKCESKRTHKDSP